MHGSNQSGVAPATRKPVSRASTRALSATRSPAHAAVTARTGPPANLRPPYRVPAAGSRPYLQPMEGPDSFQALGANSNRVESAVRILGIKIVATGLAGLLVAIVGLITVALRRRYF